MPETLAPRGMTHFSDFSDLTLKHGTHVQIKIYNCQEVVQAFNPSRDRQISEFLATVVYRVSFRTARATQRNPVLKNPKGKEKKKEFYFK